MLDIKGIDTRRYEGSISSSLTLLFQGHILQFLGIIILGRYDSYAIKQQKEVRACTSMCTHMYLLMHSVRTLSLLHSCTAEQLQVCLA